MLLPRWFFKYRTGLGSNWQLTVGRNDVVVLCLLIIVHASITPYLSTVGSSIWTFLSMKPLFIIIFKICLSNLLNLFPHILFLDYLFRKNVTLNTIFGYAADIKGFMLLLVLCFWIIPFHSAKHIFLWIWKWGHVL